MATQETEAEALERHKAWVERAEPYWTVKRVTRSLAIMLEDYADLALSSGTEPDVVLEWLKSVRKAVFTVKPGGK